MSYFQNTKTKTKKKATIANKQIVPKTKQNKKSKIALLQEEIATLNRKRIAKENSEIMASLAEV